MGSILAWLIAIAQNVIGSFLFSLLGVLLGILVIDRYKQCRDKRAYGGWHVIVCKGSETKVDRVISVRKAKEILDEPSELSVFIKGVVSPYDRLNCDILDKTRYPDLLTQDDTKRRFVVNLDENPSAEARNSGTVL